MLTFLILFWITAVVCFLVALDECKRKSSEDYIKATFVKFSLYFTGGYSIVALFMLVVFIGGSYESYVDTRTFYDSTVEQYSTAVEMYGDKAVIDVESAAWTDLKYQGYQENMSKAIRLLREKIVKYNKKIISKRIMKRNLFFNWLIVAPDDDMKVIAMKTADQHVLKQ